MWTPLSGWWQGIATGAFVRAEGNHVSALRRRTGAAPVGVEVVTIQVRNSRAVFKIVLLIGILGLAISYAIWGSRISALPIVSAVAAIVGLVGVLDRRIKLELGDAGIRYERWCSDVILWNEFSAFRHVSKGPNIHVQLVPVRPQDLLERFSLAGKLNQRLAGLTGAPAFSISVTGLDIEEKNLVDAISKYLAESQ
jgi:hypothetical protein